ncbi:unnamed protein product [Owenia fusiformis]|uniref:Uncharacterized protein n=1 Tax=Owenia fusiformis TaxID=6347 RepID=A0A8J1Y547_OWEFU|nr:unnamed protein product [Owenia fusiformis]
MNLGNLAVQAVMTSSCTESEMNCVIHWFTSWTTFQRADFGKELLKIAVPESVDNLFEAMGTLNVNNKPPSIFKCQLKLFLQWFDNWNEAERNNLMIRIQQCDPSFMAELNAEIAQLKQNL